MNFYLSNIKMEFCGLQQEQYFFLKKVLDSNINEDDFIDIFYYYFNKPINKPELSNKYVKLLSGRYYNNEKEYYIEYYNNNLANWDIKKEFLNLKM